MKVRILNPFFTSQFYIHALPGIRTRYPLYTTPVSRQFEITWKLGILPNRGRKKILFSNVKNVATVVLEASSNSLCNNINVSDISHSLDVSYFTLQKVLLCILQFYPYKIKPVHLLQNGDSEFRKNFALQFFSRMVPDVDWLWNILWSDESHFYLNGQINVHTSGQEKILTLSRNHLGI